MTTEQIDRFKRELKQNIQGDVTFDQMTRGIYATDASHYQMMPSCIVVPKDNADTIHAIKIAHKHNIPLTSRGGGTSLSGQTFGPGIVLDFSKYMDKVLEVNEAEQWARVQPGAVRDRINAQFAKLNTPTGTGLHFSPDPATGSRATIGGMIGNNTSGTRSIVYGKAIDNVISCTFALDDGTILECESLNQTDWQHKEELTDREGDVYRQVRQVIEQNADEIKSRYPKVMRRVSGYNLDEFVDGAGYTGPIGGRDNAGHRLWNLSNLLVGSEGTIGILLEAKIKLTPLPKATAICAVHFDDDIESLRAVPEINKHDPSAVELLDKVVLDEAMRNPATKHMATFIDPHPDDPENTTRTPAAIQVVEVFAETPEEASNRMLAFAEAMKSKGIGYAHHVRTDPKRINDVWEVRKLGLGLISNVKGPIKGQAFVEDACVPVEVLGDYIAYLKQICTDKNVPTSMYAHSSVGVIHFRPMIDLHDPEQRQKMVEIAEAAFHKVCEYGGTFAGEHGDGIVRGQFIPTYYGQQIYDAFKQIKNIFDPKNLMNPGKIIDTPSMISNLRYGDQYRVAEIPSNYNYHDQGGFQLAVEQCNGVGACRKVGSGTMCPSYMATRDEEATTRGRANALRLAMSNQLGKLGLSSTRLKKVLDLCLACKACKSECPNAVDMAKLKSDTLQMHHDAHGTPLGYKLMGRVPQTAKLIAGPLAHINNAMMKLPGVNILMEKFLGIDRRRPMPPFATTTLKKELAKRNHRAPSQQSTPATNVTNMGGKKVVLFDDTYANYFEPHVGLAAVDLLEAAGYEVIIANAGCCQRTRMSKGLVREAKKLGTKTIQNLDKIGRDANNPNSGGAPILCLEPSCASSLVDDLPDLIDDTEMCKRVAARVKMIDIFLQEEGISLESTVGDILLHGHCHQKAMFGTTAIETLYENMSDASCEEAGAGCCGMAGSFGYEQFDVSKLVGEERLFPAVRKAVSEGKTIVACGISCRHQLHDFLDVKAKHFVEVVKVAATNHAQKESFGGVGDGCCGNCTCDKDKPTS
ncbi:putative FAD-linked oxidoreductase [Poriferisphaera corsica]|uniref:Putative FAD-linked oxidoreductase n=1 Tax=Poriferisphaera corsica TaxID=2528020 RepID=A0A517YPS8_9BACT|nr:FAD-binding and (Fe-S)-binding domain-containing protein [Poriferisphaera corsica]QDU32222.1 putative FAD-linked oxidoreductase [Poriferisphaera corsica]